MHQKIYALIDINNCYVSCERLFQPSLNHRPVVVLSNNDGCVVSRSQEAKNIGIKMAAPLFQIKNLIEKHQVTVLSSNYAVYAEMSKRFNQVIQSFVHTKDTEIYSIDETFIDLTSYQNLDLNQFTLQIKETLWRWLSLPVCIGIGFSKTEAKLANHIAKKYSHYQGICNLVEMDPSIKESIFSDLPVGDIWGVGKQQNKKLHSLGIRTVLDLALTNPNFIEKQFSVILKRTVLELTGISCIELEQISHTKKQIISSKSFGTRVTDLTALAEAMSDYLQNAVHRLRQENSLCGCIIAFAQSNPLDTHHPYYHKSIHLSLPEPTDSAVYINKFLQTAISELYCEGIEFKKCGVILTAIEEKSQHNRGLLFDDTTLEKCEVLQDTLSKIQEKFGSKTLAIGTCKIPNRTWAMQRQYLSPNYFSWDGLLTIKD